MVCTCWALCIFNVCSDVRISHVQQFVAGRTKCVVQSHGHTQRHHAYPMQACKPGCTQHCQRCHGECLTCLNFSPRKFADFWGMKALAKRCNVCKSAFVSSFVSTVFLLTWNPLNLIQSLVHEEDTSWAPCPSSPSVLDDALDSTETCNGQ